MADPTKFVPGYSYAGYQASNPADPLPGDRVDADMAGIQTSIGELVDAVKNVRRSDGKLANAIVEPESLSALVVTMLSTAGMNYRGAWLTATAYAVKDFVLQGGQLYFCASAHTSGTFATDLAAVRWVALTLSSASGVSFTPSGTIAATNVQAAIAELNTEVYAELTAIKANNWVTTVRILDAAVTGAKLAATLDLSTKTLTLPDACVTAANLASTLDLSGKTVTLPAASVTASNLAGTLDLTGKVVVLPNGATGVTASPDDSSAKIATTAYVDTASRIRFGVAQLGGSAVDFTGIPAAAKRVTIMFGGVSTNGSSDFLIQIGPASAVETSGYEGSAELGGTTAASTAGFIVRNAGAPSLHSGLVTLLNLTGNRWVASGVVRNSTATSTGGTHGGQKILAAPLERLRLTTVGGVDVFDNGTANVSWEL